MNKTIKDAPKCLNTNDKAMWVLGWNECHAAQRRVLEQVLEALWTSANPKAEAAITAIQEQLK